MKNFRKDMLMKLNLNSTPKTKEEATNSNQNKEVQAMLKDMEMTKYYERVKNNQLTPKEKKARENMEKLLDTSPDDIFNGSVLF